MSLRSVLGGCEGSHTLTVQRRVNLRQGAGGRRRSESTHASDESGVLLAAAAFTHLGAPLDLLALLELVVGFVGERSGHSRAKRQRERARGRALDQSSEGEFPKEKHNAGTRVLRA